METVSKNDTDELQQRAKRHFWRGCVALLGGSVLMKDDMNSLYHLAHDIEGMTGVALAGVGLASMYMAVRRDNQKIALDQSALIAQERQYDAAEQLRSVVNDRAELESASEEHDWERDIDY